MEYSVIDLFAGPGGLGEGFSSFSHRKGQFPFHIEMSVEKEKSAHKTLELRAFFRQFSGRAPKAYYQYLKGENELDRAKLFAAYPKKYAAAQEETLYGPRALGNKEDDQLIYKRLRSLRKTKKTRVVIGGPPCQAYSLIGRARNKGKKGYLPENDERHFLYEEYLKVLSTIKPEVFVMENVKGILSSKVNDQPVFPSILQDLRHPSKSLGVRGGKEYKIYSLVCDQDGERVEDEKYIIRAEQYGIPQARHRVILLGVRSDFNASPSQLKLAENEVTTQNVIYDLPSLRSGVSKGADSPEVWKNEIAKAIRKIDKAVPSTVLEKSKLNAVSKQASALSSRGSQFQARSKKFKGSNKLREWYLDDRLDGFTNHETRAHITDDLTRYLFCALYAEQKSVSPKAKNFPQSLSPRHANWNSGSFSDRFKVQVANKPASTITSHISKDGHYYIHPIPAQCRSLTVREAARLQTFPDNYFFEGNRTQQYVQVGNAVPPLLAKQIAEIVYKLLQAEHKSRRTLIKTKSQNLEYS